MQASPQSNYRILAVIPWTYPSSKQPLIYFLPSVLLFLEFYVMKYNMWSFDSSFFTYHDVFEVYPCFSTCQYLVPFIHLSVDDWIVSSIWLLSMNNAAMNTQIQSLYGQRLSFVVSGYQEQNCSIQETEKLAPQNVHDQSMGTVIMLPFKTKRILYM